MFENSLYRLTHGTELWLVLVVLLIFLPLCVELGFFIARFCERRGGGYKMTETIPSSILGVHALLIGFTFSMSIARYESRRELVVKEANAIGTAYLRSQVLPPATAEKSKELFYSYIKEELQFGRMSYGQGDMAGARGRIGQIQKDLWLLAQKSAMQNHSPIDAIYLQSLNEMIDVNAERWAALNNRLPLTVMGLLILTLSASLISFGFVEAAKQQKGGVWLVVLSVLFAVVLTMILDLDRPRRGLVKVSQAPMEELYNSMMSDSR